MNGESTSAPTRTCVVCRRELPRDEALRFVLAPDGVAALDLRRKLPGRGASCCWTRPCIEGIRKGGKLDRAFHATVALPPGDWPLSQVREHVERRQRELLGLAARAGELKSGGNVVEGLLKSVWAQYLVLAADAGPTVAAQWEERAARRELPLLRSLLGAEGIGAALGRTGARSVLAAGSGPLARNLRIELKKGFALL
jgi:predicted RNA-binding protein YlxR (DUF448 family)